MNCSLLGITHLTCEGFACPGPVRLGSSLGEEGWPRQATFLRFLYQLAGLGPGLRVRMRAETGINQLFLSSLPFCLEECLPQHL